MHWRHWLLLIGCILLSCALPITACDDTLPPTKDSGNEQQPAPTRDGAASETPERPQERTSLTDSARAEPTPEDTTQPRDGTAAEIPERRPEPAIETTLDEGPRWQIKLMTFNIRYGSAKDGDNAWDKRKQLAYRVLTTHKPDILGMQEAEKNQIDDIINAIPSYKCIGRSRDANPNTGEWAPVCYNATAWQVDPNEQGTLWLSQTPETPGSKSWGSSLPRIATWARLQHIATKQRIYIFNAHFDHRSAEARLESAKLLARRIAGRLHRKEPTILLGDLNAGEKSEPIRFLKGNAVGGQTSLITLFDTYRTIHPNARDVGTIHSFRGIKTRDKIDYILAIASWPGQRIENAQIHYDNDNGRYPSDHFPLTTTLSYPMP